jgi:hypothetical protein
MYSGWSPARYLYSLNRVVSGRASAALSRSAVTLTFVVEMRPTAPARSDEGRRPAAGVR